jgi:protein PhnA
MSIEKDLQERSGSKCELCGSNTELTVFEVPSSPNTSSDSSAYLCTTCISQIENSGTENSNHWRCLNDSMWSETPVIQVLAWRMLNRLKNEGWPSDLLDMMYLDDDTLAWAKASGEGEEAEDKIIHKDSNGATLASGDTVVLIKDLNVKGANFVAKRGTAVRNISLVFDNAEQIEGRVNGQHIVILTQFVKKTS